MENRPTLLAALTAQHRPRLSSFPSCSFLSSLTFLTMPQQPTQKPRFGQDPTARPNRRSTLSLGVTSVAAERRAQAQQDFHTAATLFMEVQRSDVPIAKEVADTRVGPAFAACHCMSDAVARQEVSEDPASIHRSSGVEEYVNAVKHFKDVLDQGECFSVCSSRAGLTLPALIHDRAARLQYLERLQSAWRTDLLSLLPARNTAEEELLKAPLEIVRDEERGGPSARQHASAKELALQVIRSRAVSGEVQTFMVHVSRAMNRVTDDRLIPS